MWIAYSNKGTKIEMDFWDWTCMHKLMKDYEEEFGMTEDEAYVEFWENVKNYDTEWFNDCVWNDPIEKAIGDGRLDELRACYLSSLNIECVKIDD